MKKMMNRGSLAALAGLMVLSPLASANTDTLSIEANILSPLTLTKSADMSFGDIIPDDAASSTVTLAADGSISVAGGATTPGGNHGVGKFVLVGANATPVTVTHDTSLVLTRAGGSETMTVDNFTYQANVGTLSGVPTSGNVVVNLDATGNAEIDMGADLEVGIDQAAGTYEATMTLTAAY